MLEKEAFAEAARLLPKEVRGLIRHRLSNTLSVITGYLGMAATGSYVIDKHTASEMLESATKLSNVIDSFTGDHAGRPVTEKEGENETN